MERRASEEKTDRHTGGVYILQSPPSDLGIREFRASVKKTTAEPGRDPSRRLSSKDKQSSRQAPDKLICLAGKLPEIASAV